jgi:HSP20 family protein
MEPTKTPVADLSELLARTVGSRIGTANGVRPNSPHLSPCDVKETSSEYLIVIDLPGVDEDEIHLAFQDGVFTCQVDREFDHDAEDAEEYIRLDRPYGHFETKVMLGGDGVFDLATAKYKRGVLKVRIPRRRA